MSLSWESLNEQSVDISVPANMHSLLVVRLAVSGAASPHFDMDQLEDVKTAVNEACYALIHQRQSFERLMLSFALEEESFVMTITGNKAHGNPDGMAPDAQMCKSILETIVDEAHIACTGESMCSIRLVKHTTPI